MLNAILESKSGRLHRDGEEGLRWKDIFRESEDLVTATLFERLSYLPGGIAWAILVSASNGVLAPYRLAEIRDMSFWPMWAAEGRSRGVEPDIFIECELGDPVRNLQVIVEAKHGGAQTTDQLCGELNAWLEGVDQGEFEQPDEVMMIAIGGVDKRTWNGIANAVGAHVCARLDALDIDLTIVAIDWSDLARAASLQGNVSPHVDRIIGDMTRALALFGYFHAVTPRQLEALAPRLHQARATLSELLVSNQFSAKALK